MKEKQIFNLKEITMMMINLVTVKLFFGFPKRLILNSGNAAWIQVIYIFALAAVLFFILAFLYKACPKESLISLSGKIGGKGLKSFVGMIVSLVLFLNFSATVKSYPDMVKMALLPEAPIEMILLLYAVTICAAAYMGTEPIARIHAVFIPGVLTVMGVFFVFLIPHFKLYNIFPILGNGVRSIFADGFWGLELFGDLLVLTQLMPYLKEKGDAKKSGIRAVAVGGAAAFFLVLSYGMIYPYPSSEKFVVPIYQLMRLVGIGDFFQRFEAFFEFVWTPAVFLYSSLYLSVICMTIKESFDLKYEKPLIIPIMAITMVLSFDIKDMGEAIEFYKAITIITTSTAFLLPAIVTGIYRKKQG